MKTSNAAFQDCRKTGGQKINHAFHLGLRPFLYPLPFPVIFLPQPNLQIITKTINAALLDCTRIGDQDLGHEFHLGLRPILYPHSFPSYLPYPTQPKNNNENY